MKFNYQNQEYRISFHYDKVDEPVRGHGLVTKDRTSAKISKVMPGFDKSVEVAQASVKRLNKDPYNIEDARKAALKAVLEGFSKEFRESAWYAYTTRPSKSKDISYRIKKTANA